MRRSETSIGPDWTAILSASESRTGTTPPSCAAVKSRDGSRRRRPITSLRLKSALALFGVLEQVSRECRTLLAGLLTQISNPRQPSLRYRSTRSRFRHVEGQCAEGLLEIQSWKRLGNSLRGLASQTCVDDGVQRHTRALNEYPPERCSTYLLAMLLFAFRLPLFERPGLCRIAPQGGSAINAVDKLTVGERSK